MQFQARHLKESTISELDMNGPAEESMLFQLKRSKRRIEQLLEQNNRLRNVTDTHAAIITSQQEQLRVNIFDKKQLEDTVTILMEELKELRLRMALAEEKRQEEKLEEELAKLRQRYANCQEQNIFLRRDNKEKDQKIDQLQSLLQAKKNQNHKLMQALDKMAEDLQSCRLTIDTISKANIDLQRTVQDLLQRETHLQALLSDYGQRLGMTGQQLNEAQRNQQGWFCELNDLRDTVEHIEQLRELVRTRKTMKQCL